MREFKDIETRLRRQRPQPREEFLALLAQRHERRPRRVRARLALVAAVTAAFAIPLAATGGVAYAKSAVGAVAAAAKVVVTAPLASPGKSGSHTPAAPAAADKESGSTPEDDQYGHKKLVCHNPGAHQHTISVDAAAVPALLAHGDYLGACRS
jgi:hypothetical protein